MKPTTTSVTVLLLASLGLTASSWAQEEPDWSKIEIKREKVAGSVYMLYGVGGFSGGNIGVSVGEDGIVLVDDQFEPLVPKIESALEGITKLPVRFVLNVSVTGLGGRKGGRDGQNAHGDLGAFHGSLLRALGRWDGAAG